MPAYVTLPGTSGNYFTTPLVNLIGGDTANLAQSTGDWAPGEAALTFEDDAEAFGGKAVQETSTLGNSPYPFSLAIGNAIPVAASTEYTLIYNMKRVGTGTATHFRPLIRDYDSSNVAGTSHDGSHTAIVDDTWMTLTHTFTTAPDAAKVRIWCRLTDGSVNTNMSIGEAYRLDSVCLRAGTSTTFVPSLRINNDLEIEWKVALDDYTPTVTNTIFDCLNSNDGYRIRHTTGDLIEIAYGNGSSTRAQTSAATGLTDGTDHVFKVTVDQSTGAVVYYIDGVQHDTDTMTTGAGSTDINAPVVGANAAASANWTDGDIYYVIVRDGIDGPVVARFDADDWVGV